MWRLQRLVRIALAGALFLLVSGCCQDLTKKSFEHDGLQRVYYLYEPANLPATNASLVIVLHGKGTDGCQAATQTGMNTLAENQGFLVAYPNGYKKSWNATLCCDDALSEGIDDVGFILGMINRIDTNQNYSIDSRRIYVAGFSNGGFMAHVLACRLSDRLAAVGIAGGSGPIEPADCTPTHPISVVVFHGDDDDRIDIEGDDPGPDVERSYGLQEYPAIQDVVGFWADHNNCNPPTTSMVGTVAELQEHRSSTTGGAAVWYYKVLDGNHSWPGGKRVSLSGKDPYPPGISATELMWDFFSAHPRP